MSPINFLRQVRWSSLHVHALLVIVGAVYGVFSFVISDLPRSNLFGTGDITNPVYWNDQRLTPDKALEQLTNDFAGNFAAVIGFSAVILLLIVHYKNILFNLII